jgi:dCTP deaminase
MSVASANTLKRLRPFEPFVDVSQRQNGMSYGLSHCGYDIRVKQDVVLGPWDFSLASSLEKFVMPKNYVAIVHDKSTWARKGLACQNTVIEPGWEGYLTLELTNHGDDTIRIQAGDPIAQIIFHKIDEEVEGYQGKYQNQEDRPVEARYELEDKPVAARYE